MEQNERVYVPRGLLIIDPVERGLRVVSAKLLILSSLVFLFLLDCTLLFCRLKFAFLATILLWRQWEAIKFFPVNYIILFATLYVYNICTPLHNMYEMVLSLCQSDPTSSLLYPTNTCSPPYEYYVPVWKLIKYPTDVLTGSFVCFLFIPAVILGKTLNSVVLLRSSIQLWGKEWNYTNPS